MTPIAIQISRSKVSTKGQAYSLYVRVGGISVLQTSILTIHIYRPFYEIPVILSFCPVFL